LKLGFWDLELAAATAFGNCFTNVRTDSANKNVRSSRSRGFAPSSILELGFEVYLGFGFWDLELAASTAFGNCFTNAHRFREQKCLTL
jgi:hypothetical protein